MPPRWTIHLIVLSHLGLIALIFAWIFWFLPPDHWPRPILLLLGILPLALPLRGVMQGEEKSYIWAAYLSLLYLTHAGSTLWIGTPPLWLPLVETLLATTLFVAVTLYFKAKPSPS
jgi:uncharacterized membrane protein